MDNSTSSITEKHLIYQIFRACRLCGAGAGYKMPIIQNVVDLDSGEVELKHKIRECVQIEVHQEDKMPPLICELCVDKVNDFYEFLEMCRQTNKHTRLRLGLPPQTLPRGAPDAGDCILGLTEPVFLDNEDSNEPIAKGKGKSVKSVKVKKETDREESKSKMTHKKDTKREEHRSKPGPRSMRRRSSPAPPEPPPDAPRTTRGSKRQHDDDVSLTSSPEKKLRNSVDSVSNPKSILKKEKESKSVESRTKVSRENEKDKNFNTKKVQIVVRKMSPAPSPKPASSPKSTPTGHRCQVCQATFAKRSSLTNHIRTHAQTKPVERKPSPPPKKEVKKIECKVCERQFPHKNLLEIHRCGGRVKSSRPAPEPKPEPRPSKPAKPSPVKRVVPVKKKPYIEPVIDPEIKKQLQPLQVRISKCDPLLENKIGEHYDVSDVDYDYGVDKTCVYPYIYTFRHLRIKSEPSYMVNIHEEIRNDFDTDDELADETDSDLDLGLDNTSVRRLAFLALRVVSANKLGKHKKRRKSKAFDSIMNSSDLRSGIDNIINSLDDKAKSSDVGNVDKADNDSLFGDDNSPAVTNNDFDSLFSQDDDVTKADDVTDSKNGADDTNEENTECNNKSNTVVSSTDDCVTKSDDVIKANDVTDSKNGADGVIDDSVKVSNDAMTNNDSNDTKDSTELNSKDDELNDLKNDTNDKDDTSDKINDQNDKHLNGESNLSDDFKLEDLEDVSDTEMEDGKVDKDIGESETANAKTNACEREDTTVKSTDLESVSDGDFE